MTPHPTDARRCVCCGALLWPTRLAIIARNGIERLCNLCERAA